VAAGALALGAGGYGPALRRARNGEVRPKVESAAHEMAAAAARHARAQRAPMVVAAGVKMRNGLIAHEKHVLMTDSTVLRSDRSAALVAMERDRKKSQNS
jgi:hypothetical protein